MANTPVQTPLMKQYFRIKQDYPDAVLLFRVGDFYETFCDDAIRASEILGITLTRRANGAAQYVELAGFPHHALDTYLPKLVRQGLRVAICDQLEDPKAAKGIVKRGITELVTPGVSTNDNVLEVKENNFLAAVYIHQNRAGFSFLDISTGEFLVGEDTLDNAAKMIASFAPKEVVYEESQRNEISKIAHTSCKQKMADWVFTLDSARDRLTKQFKVKNFKGFGIERFTLGQIAAGAALYYLDQTKHPDISHINTIARVETDKYVWLDDFTIKNLELVNSRGEGKCLYNIIDRTSTPMGARLLHRWLLFPLKELQPINDRLDIVTQMFRSTKTRDALRDQLAIIGDMERIISKVAVHRASPREIVQLKCALAAVEQIKQLCQDCDDCAPLAQVAAHLTPCTELQQKIEKYIQNEPPTLVSRGNVINDGVDDELDSLRSLAHNSKRYLEEIQNNEARKNDIPSLKIGFNNVFGYYLEVRNTHKDKVPPEWIRKQTLVNAERYITEELKDLESRILGATDRMLEIETKLFQEILADCSEYIASVQRNCTEIARLDCLVGFAYVAAERKYNRPVPNDSLVIDIKEGRHPVIESQLPLGEQYIPNDVRLDNDSQQIMMITGPNMSGKSALLRQTALIVLLTQIGSYVPAASAKIGIVDKIFTRVGANDNISAGDSTFMVEMNEAASILNNVTPKSLVLFDELGRGTSTYDGISIAWAITEYLHENKRSAAKTLFATHYHELNEMEKTYPRIRNYNVSVREVDNKVIFMRKLEKGGSEHSFGIHVAKMAGMPEKVIKRAEKILKSLESDNRQSIPKIAEEKKNDSAVQLSFFQLDDPVLKAVRDEIVNIQINNLTPVEALIKLNEIKKIVTGRSD